MLGPLEGEVAYVEALGRETFLGVNLKSASPSLESASPSLGSASPALDSPPRFVVSVAGRAAVRPGDSVRFGFVADGLLLFDGASGRALGAATARR